MDSSRVGPTRECRVRHTPTGQGAVRPTDPDHPLPVTLPPSRGRPNIAVPTGWGPTRMVVTERRPSTGCRPTTSWCRVRTDRRTTLVAGYRRDRLFPLMRAAGQQR